MDQVAEIDVIAKLEHVIKVDTVVLDAGQGILDKRAVKPVQIIPLVITVPINATVLKEHAIQLQVYARLEVAGRDIKDLHVQMNVGLVVSEETVLNVVIAEQVIVIV